MRGEKRDEQLGIYNSNIFWTRTRKDRIHSNLTDTHQPFHLKQGAPDFDKISENSQTLQKFLQE